MLVEFFFIVHIHFLNRDILLNICRKCLKLHVCMLHNHSEGTVSQNCYLSPSFHFMKSRKIYFKNQSKVTRFFIIKRDSPREIQAYGGGH